MDVHSWQLATILDYMSYTLLAHIDLSDVNDLKDPVLAAITFLEGLYIVLIAHLVLEHEFIRRISDPNNPETTASELIQKGGLITESVCFEYILLEARH